MSGPNRASKPHKPMPIRVRVQGQRLGALKPQPQTLNLHSRSKLGLYPRHNACDHGTPANGRKSVQRSCLSLRHESSRQSLVSDSSRFKGGLSGLSASGFLGFRTFGFLALGLWGFWVEGSLFESRCMQKLPLPSPSSVLARPRGMKRQAKH